MLTLVLALAALAQQPEPVTVDHDDVRIDSSCVLRIGPDPIPDANHNGVIQIDADDITVTFADGAVLSGAAPDAAPDTFSGVGIAINGHKNVTIKNARVSGFKVAIQAEHCPGLTIEGAELTNNFRHHLRSTAKAEDGADWLFPHHNDGGEWLKNYGASLAVKDSAGVTLRKNKIRKGQNGIVLDRVTASRIYDNDCSFLSGWGLALWRSSSNTITRNALDFCVRGYSHGIYNRGQDSAGLLMFEQCSSNIIAENSITHGGDGIFGFAGIEAIGDTWWEQERERLRTELGADGIAKAREKLAASEQERLRAQLGPDAKLPETNRWSKADDNAVLDATIQVPPEVLADFARKGNNDNYVIANDLSDAPAHGLEMTFSYDNRVFLNTFSGNAICGIWGGYSGGTLIAQNTFDRNGEMAYGLERGGINIEHGAENVVVANTFRNNKCGVHLWWDDDGILLKKPGVTAENKDVTDNLIIGNTFTADDLALQLRDDSPKKDKVRGTVFAQNQMTGVKKETDVAQGIDLVTTGEMPPHEAPTYQPLGDTHPVGARKELAGRQNIIMTEWGPWEHTGPMVRAVQTGGASHSYEIYNIDPKSVRVTGNAVHSRNGKVEKDKPWTLTIDATQPGVKPYTIEIDDDAAKYKDQIKGSLLSLRWELSVFPWEGPPGPNPPPDLDKWRALARSPQAKHARTDRLSFPFGSRGPSEMNISPEITAAKFRPDYFGIIATARAPLSKGKWRIKTTSDDGIHVMVDGKLVIDNWTHHGATDDSAEFEVKSENKPVEFTVEYFEIFGAAVLDFQLEPAQP
jgi:parallel beta-helix repeat protein